jgi:hypothetical protein
MDRHFNIYLLEDPNAGDIILILTDSTLMEEQNGGSECKY